MQDLPRGSAMESLHVTHARAIDAADGADWPGLHVLVCVRPLLSGKKSVGRLTSQRLSSHHPNLRSLPRLRSIS